jgi:truncated hemoglobin YjbI
MTQDPVQSDDFVPAAVPDESNIRALVDAFYQRVHADPLLAPIFARELSGRWDAHLAKMTTFWSSLVLGSKQVSKPYSGNVQEAHRPLDDIEPQHFARWLALFLDTVQLRYAPRCGRPVHGTGAADRAKPATEQIWLELRRSRGSASVIGVAQAFENGGARRRTRATGSGSRQADSGVNIAPREQGQR